MARSSSVRPRLVGGRRGGGPSSVAPCSRNQPTGQRRDSPISSSLFSHGLPGQSVNSSPAEPVLSRSSRQSLGHLQSHFDGGWHVCQPVRLSFQSCSLLLLSDESSGVTVGIKLFRDFNLLSFVVCVPCGRQQSSWCEEGRYRPVGVHCPSSLV